ncbi:MAG: hydroxymethylglutaryl-CoA lyase [Gammaproteobacteria bacterium]|nr:hydroxymethylglutaryl-CoA lyase [Gammaproteobacteria bacterium]
MAQDLQHVEIVEVGPRDGLQSQPTLLDTATRIEFITRLVDAGVRRLEVASFVNPRRVPQMADVEQVIAGLPRRANVTYIGLVLNRRGFERAQASGLPEVNCVAVASETFSQRNQGMGIADTLTGIAATAADARAAGIRCGVTIGASFGCPFEGEVPVDRVVDIARRLVDAGVDEIALADTIGVGVPSEVVRLVAALRPVIGAIPLRCHFHNTRNTGIANAYAAVQAGVRVLDASCGGIGGCPFAPSATGNVATEDVLYLLERMGLHTGVSIEGIMATARWLEGPLGIAVPAMVTRAGLFPRREVCVA